MASGWTHRLLLLAAVVTLGATPIAAASMEYLVTAPGYLTPNADIKITAVVTNPSSAGQLKVDLWGTRSGIQPEQHSSGKSDVRRWRSRY
uniref:Ixosin-B n=1 Tax=Ixodes sinensis TaxID=339422 RepID=IXOSB_IXOSI|nr:RecName: Full=Ixosin-B; Flags: Precursor [Ixodes sinensis]ABU24471.1 ixosin [Ixodes sinensis]